MEEICILSNEECEDLDIEWNMQMLSNDMSGKPFIVL